MKTTMMMMMKRPIILVACVLLFSSLAVLASESSAVPTECCFAYVPRRLRKNNVLTFQYTDDRCAVKAVIFTMKRTGSPVCADPSVPWVKNIVEAREWAHIKKGNSSVSSESN